MIELCCEYLSVRCIWLNVLIMSRMHFRVNPCSSLMPHHRVNNRFDRVKGLHWRLLIYALRNPLLCNNVTCFQKQPSLFLKVSQIPQENICVGVSYRPAGLFHVCFSLYLIIHVNYVKSHCLYKSLSK